ncbi:MAG: PQQ-dependent sugar dehydrogenase [Myxococcales bacterium]|nr:PQQ-dependent sugar dehydrogenase [Myxococcales bacterium]
MTAPRPCLAILALATALGCGDGEASGATMEADGGASPSAPRFAVESLELDRPLPYATDFAFIPGSDELLVLLKDGRILHYRLGGDRLEPLGELRIEGLHDEEDCGLISLAFDPAFADNGYLYVGLCLSAQESGVFRHVFDPADYDRTAASRAPVVVEAEASAQDPWHNVGALAFGESGHLWVAFGDKTHRANAADTTNVLGGLLRIEPELDAAGEGHAPAANNPLVGMDGDDALYAWGLRSPWRLAIDGRGRVWVGDVGLDDYEEINVVDAAGLDLGWPASEGPCGTEVCADTIDPVVVWSHDEEDPHVLDDPEAEPTTLRVAWVGLEYREAETDRYRGQLQGGMLYGDACLGNLRIAELDGSGELVRDEHLTHLGSGTMALRLGPDDYLYGLTMGACVTSGTGVPHGSFFRLVLR